MIDWGYPNNSRISFYAKMTGKKIACEKNCLAAFVFLNLIFKMSINMISNSLLQIYRKDIFAFLKIVSLKVAFERCFGAGEGHLENPML